MSYLVPFNSKSESPSRSNPSEVASGKGRWKSLSRSRRLVCDLLHETKSVPSCAHDRDLYLAHIRELRSQAGTRISWPALFIKAYSIVAARFEVLRQSYMPWPWPHIYEHPHSVAMVAVSRQFRGEDWLFFGRFLAAENLSLMEIQQQLDAYQTQEPDKVFRRQWNLSMWPTPIRRMLWWMSLKLEGARRARRMGTFGLTTIANRGATIQQPPNFLTSTITYGPLNDEGQCRFTLTYDHRLMDGMTVAQILEELQNVFDAEIANELISLADASNERHAA